MAQIKASGGLTCIYPADARVYRVAVDFLSAPTKDAQGNIIAPATVLERQVRYVSVTDPNTLRAQSTYGSFLAHLALGDVNSAVALGFAAESRATYASAFGPDPVAIKKIANGLTKIVATEQSSDQIHLRIDLGDGEIGDVFMHRDEKGIWRISQL